MAKNTASKVDLHELSQKAASSAIFMVAASTVIVVFCLVSAKAMLAQASYQRRVVNAKHETVDQLKKNLEAAKTLTNQYDAFVSTSPNIIGGNGNAPDDATPPDGKNNRIVLDALPTEYDYPALRSSLQKLVDLDSLADSNVGGTDQSSSFEASSSGAPTPVQIQQITISGNTSVAGAKKLLVDLERSIRPYDVTTLQLTINGNSASVNVAVNTYFQPAKQVTIGSKVVK